MLAALLSALRTDLHRVDDARLEHVDIHAGIGVVADVGRFLRYFVDHHRAVDAAVVGDLLHRSRQSVQHDVDADLFVSLGLRANLLDHLAAANQGHSAAGQNAFFDGRPGGVQGVFDASLLLLHVRLGIGTDRDDRHAAGQLGQPLLELFAIVFAVRGRDLVADLLDAILDVGRLAGALDDRGRIFVDRDLLGPAQLLQRQVFELQPQVFADQRAGGQHGNVAEQSLAAIAKARSLDRTDVEHAAQLVDDQRRQRLAIDVLGNDQQRFAGLGNAFQDGNQIAQDC